MPNALDDAAAKGAGFAHAAAARLKGLTGVFNTLAEQHAEVHALLKSAQGASSAHRQRELWPRIRAELLSHERAELLHVYGELKNHEVLSGAVEKHRIEAKQLEAAIERLDTSDYAGDAWESNVHILLEMVEQHTREEEDEVFPLALEIVGKEMAAELDARFANTKQTLMAELVDPERTRL